MYKTLLFGILICVFQNTATAQIEYGTINPNSIRATFSSSGRQFFLEPNTPRFNVPFDPSGINTSTISLGTLWFMAIDSLTGDTLMALQTYGQNGSDFLPGPLPPGVDTGFTPPDVHLVKFLDSEVDQGTKDSNKLVSGVSNWPAYYSYQGTNYTLARFIDKNSNGLYEPKLGDIPHYNGEEFIYFVYHDMVKHPIGKTEPLGLQIEVEAFGFYNANPLYEAVLFLRYKVVSTKKILKDFRMGLYTDFDLGNYSDDMIATDTSRNMVYAYNGDGDDEGIYGYGYNPPAMGIVFLNQPICQSCFHMNQPRWKDSVNTFRPPYYPNDYKNLLLAKSTGGDSMKVSANGKTSTYAFTGDPSTSNGWTMENDTFGPNDYKSLAVTGTPLLNKSDTFELFLMYVYARTANNGGRLGSIDSLKSKVDSYRKKGFISPKPEIPINCFTPNSKSSNPNTNVEQTRYKSENLVYPNPARQTLNIQLTESVDHAKYTLRDQAGALIFQGSIDKIAQLDVSMLASGFYILILESENLPHRETHRITLMPQ